MAKKQSNNFTIDNFLRMSPQIPQAGAQNTNYLIANADPLSYLANNLQEEQVAPLSAAGYFLPVSYSGSGAISGNIIEMIDGGGSGWDVIATADDFTVYGFSNATGKTSKLFYLGAPPVGSGGDGSAKIAIFNGNIVWTYYGQDYYYTNYLSGSSWTKKTAAFTSTNRVKYLEPFFKWLMVSDGSNVMKIDSTWVMTNGLSLGSQWDIMKLTNFNDKYLAIAATTNQGTSNNNYLYLWDGSSVVSNYSMKIPGMFQDMYVSKGVLYVLVQERYGQSALYYLSGTILRRVQSIQIDYISLATYSNGIVYGTVLSEYSGMLCIRLGSKGIMLTGQLDAGQVEYLIYDYSSSIYGVSGVATKVINAGLGLLYMSVGKNIGYYIPYSGSGNTSTCIKNINYQSQWIPVRNLSGIDIWYETPPKVSGDAITLTVYGKGENLITNGSQTINCPPIVYNAIDSQQRTRVDLRDISTGEQFAGDQVMVKLTTTLGTNSTWYPIIRSINLI